MLTRYKLYTGPTQAVLIADKLRQHPGHYRGVFAGTEHVYFLTTLNTQGTFEQLKLDGVTGYRYTDLRATATSI